MAPKKVKLSKHLLQMKFMKRTKQKEEDEEEKEIETAIFKTQNFELVEKESQKFIIEPSYVPCEELRPGRLSFKGMNPEIERMMQEEIDKTLVEPENEGLTAKEMAHRYSTLVNTIGKKFSKKRSNEDNRDKNQIKSPKYDQSTEKPDKFRFRKPKD